MDRKLLFAVAAGAVILAVGVLLVVRGRIDDDVGDVVAADETVVLFPAVAWHDDEAGHWVVPVHVWAFELEPDAVIRGAAIAGLAATLGLDEGAIQSEVFAGRARWFLADNERGKAVAVVLGDLETTLPPTSASGHARHDVTVTDADMDRMLGPDGHTLTLDVAFDDGDTRAFSTQVFVPRRAGWTVVSDIDDTVKVTGVLDHRELLSRTFTREFEGAPGMADLYRSWAGPDVRFVYVSSSPWQLYPALRVWMDAAGLPVHGISLKSFRLKDSTALDLFRSSEETKPHAIEPLLQRHRADRFVLVGDSGEKDPEVYGAMYRSHPDRVARILIRNVSDETPDSERMQAAMADVPVESWQLFGDPGEVTWSPGEPG